jgi:hypothetical protein
MALVSTTDDCEPAPGAAAHLVTVGPGPVLLGPPDMNREIGHVVPLE